MNSSAIYILSISSISSLGSIIFFYLYNKYSYIHRAFGMNYLLLIQLGDFSFSFLNIIGSFPIVSNGLYCKFYYFLVHFSSCLQSILISYYFIFLYYIIYLQKEKSEVKLKKYLVVLLLISLIEPFYYTFTTEYTINKNYCKILRIRNTYFIALDLLLVVFCSNFAWCIFATFVMFGKFKSHFEGTGVGVRWTVFRLLIFPFLNWICIMPTVVYSHYAVEKGSEAELIESILYTNSCAIGFYDFIALICTKEFRDAARLEKRYYDSIRMNVLK